MPSSLPFASSFATCMLGEGTAVWWLSVSYEQSGGVRAPSPVSGEGKTPKPLRLLSQRTGRRR